MRAFNPEMSSLVARERFISSIFPSMRAMLIIVRRNIAFMSCISLLTPSSSFRIVDDMISATVGPHKGLWPYIHTIAIPKKFHWDIKCREARG